MMYNHNKFGHPALKAQKYALDNDNDDDDDTGRLTKLTLSFRHASQAMQKYVNILQTR